MKKIISLLLVTVMMLTFVFSVSAATVTTGVNVDIVEDETGLITATISAVGISDLYKVYLGLDIDTTKATLLHTDKSTVATSTSTYSDILDVVNNGFAAWTTAGTNTFSFSGTRILSNQGGSLTAPAIDCTSSTVLYKLYFKKVEGATIDADTLKNYYAVSKKTGYQSQTGTLVTSKDGFGYTVTPYVAQGGGNTGWTETDGTTTVTVKFPTSATEKAGAESSWTGNASTQASKKAVKFGKNETGAKILGATVENGKLVVNNADYFVEYDGEKYYGLIDVEAGKSWAILIIESVSAN